MRSWSPHHAGVRVAGVFGLIAALVLEATFTAIFVPVLARAERDDPDGGEGFVRRLVTLATTLLLITATLSVALPSPKCSGRLLCER